MSSYNVYEQLVKCFDTGSLYYYENKELDTLLFAILMELTPEKKWRSIKKQYYKIRESCKWVNEFKKLYMETFVPFLMKSAILEYGWDDNKIGPFKTALEKIN